MQIDIANHIEKLLFEHDTVIIPGFGGFTASRSPSQVDYAGGNAIPPSKTLSFNENLKVDDGILVYDVARAHGISNEEARVAIQRYVERTVIQLNAREIVALPGVGRLYKNYEQKIQFLPDANNLNRDAFGLPPIQFSPIARSREVAGAPEPAVAPEPVPVTAKAEESPAIATIPPPLPPIEATPIVSTTEAAPTPPPPPIYTPTPTEVPPTSGNWMGWLIGLLLVGLLGALGYHLWKQRQQPTRSIEEELEQTDISQVPVVTGPDQAPVSPPPNTAPAPTVTKVTEPTRSTAPAPKTEPKKTAPTAGSGATSTSAVKGRRCLLIIGTFKDESNVDRLVRKLESTHLEVYRRKTGIGEQLGVEFNYTDLRQIDEQVANLQRITGERNIVVKRQ